MDAVGASSDLFCIKDNCNPYIFGILVSKFKIEWIQWIHDIRDSGYWFQNKLAGVEEKSTDVWGHFKPECGLSGNFSLIIGLRNAHPSLSLNLINNSLECICLEMDIDIDCDLKAGIEKEKITSLCITISLLGPTLNLTSPPPLLKCPLSGDSNHKQPLGTCATKKIKGTRAK